MHCPFGFFYALSVNLRKKHFTLPEKKSEKRERGLILLIRVVVITSGKACCRDDICIGRLGFPCSVLAAVEGCELIFSFAQIVIFALVVVWLVGPGEYTL